jgi:GT2 family glycosyltransferase
MTRSSTPPRTPRVRVVVLNYDGGEMTLRCLRTLREVDWPQDALEVVLVDNASIDGIAPVIREEMPWVHLVEHTHNVGFAGGCNLGLHDLGAVDYVALLNNDTLPEREWLRPLVDALESDASLGAACSKIVFAPRFLTLTVDTETFRPGNDARDLGVRITGLAADGAEIWKHTQFADGCHVVSTRGTGEEQVCWTDGHAVVRIPVMPGEPVPRRLEVELAGERTKAVTLGAGAGAVTVEVGTEPTWHELPIGGELYDVVNNVGSRLVLGGYGGDRGFLEPDRGQFSEPEDVFAWCGGAVLLSARYLREVGIFDERYFMYYEDTDLSWRGQLAGWRYRYVPDSVVRHEHAASSKEGSALFVHYVERNRFLTLARNAPWSMLREAAYVYLRDTAVIFDRDVVRRVRHRSRPSTALVKLRTRAFLAFVKLSPSVLSSRARQRASAKRRTELVEQWAVPQ